MLFGPRAKDANTSDGNMYSDSSSRYGNNLPESRNFPHSNHAVLLVGPQLISNPQIMRTNSQDHLGQIIISEPPHTTIYRNELHQLNQPHHQNFDSLLSRYRQPYNSSFQSTFLHYSSSAPADLQQCIVNQPTNQSQSLTVPVISDHGVPKLINSVHLGESSFPGVSNQPLANNMKPLPAPSALNSSQRYPISSSDSGKFTNPANHSKFVQDPQRAYLDLLPIINRTTSHNFCDLLVATLRECSHQVPLDDFFNLLFNTQTAEAKSVPATGVLVDKSQRPYKKEGLMLCSYIIDTFRSPPYGAGGFTVGLVKNSHLFKINVREFRRKFLAMKIMFDCIVKVEDSSSALTSIPRSSIKQAYNFLCQKLNDNYQNKSNPHIPPGWFMISPRELGKITNLVYPKLPTRRLGRRGETKFHYVGITWNSNIIEDDFDRSIDTQSNIGSVGDRPEQETHPRPKTMNQPEGNAKKSGSPSLNSPAPPILPLKTSEHVSYSFIGRSSKFPVTDCSPRVWKFTPGKVPQRSVWSEKTILRSAELLKRFDLGIEYLIESFDSSVCSGGPSEDFIDTFVDSIYVLLGSSASQTDFLNFYLVGLLLVFPVVIASEQEVPPCNKVEFRKILNELASRLEVIARTQSIPGGNYLANFTNLLRKMIKLNEITSTHIKTCLVKSVVEEIILDFERRDVNSLESCSSSSVHEHIAIEAVLKAGFAYDFKVDGVAFTEGQEIVFTRKLARSFSEYTHRSKEHCREIPKSMNADDLAKPTYGFAFEVCMTSMQIFHNVCLSDPLVLQISIREIKLIMSQIMCELQLVSFHEFGKRAPELSKETFKTWWVGSAIMQEYINIFSEVAALAQRLSV